MQEFKVNEYISLKLENNDTVLYLNRERFRQCSHVLTTINANEIEKVNLLESVDEIKQISEKNFPVKISPEVKYFVHCSNLQAWAENNYDTRMLHSNLSFLLLRKLYEIGDPLAKKYFKEEIYKRLESGYENVIIYLIQNQYLSYFDRAELHSLFFDENDNLKKFFIKFSHEEKTEKSIFFPVLQKLTEAGDPLAKKVFKEEIYKRLESGSINIFTYLSNENYSNYLSIDEVFYALEKTKLGFMKIMEKLMENEVKDAIKRQDIVFEFNLMYRIKNYGKNKFIELLNFTLNNLNAYILWYLCDLEYLEYLELDKLKRYLIPSKLLNLIDKMVDFIFKFDDVYSKPLDYLITNLLQISNESVSILFKKGSNNVRLYLQYNNFLERMDRDEFWDIGIDNLKYLKQIENKLFEKLLITKGFVYRIENDDPFFIYNTMDNIELWIRIDKNEIKEIGIYNQKLSKKMLRWIKKKIRLITTLENLFLNDRIKPLIEKGKKVLEQEKMGKSFETNNLAINIFRRALDIANTMVNSERKERKIEEVRNFINNTCLARIKVFKDKSFQFVVQKKYDDAIRELYAALSIAKNMAFPENHNPELVNLKNLVNNVYSAMIEGIINKGNKLVEQKRSSGSYKYFQ